MVAERGEIEPMKTAQNIWFCGSMGGFPRQHDTTTTQLTSTRMIPNHYLRSFDT